MQSPCNSTIVIENISPNLKGFPIKAVQGQSIKVQAEIFNSQHEIIKANLKFKTKDSSAWNYVPLSESWNNEWFGEFAANENNVYFYTIEAWKDPLSTWLDEVKKKTSAGLEVKNETFEGLQLLKQLHEIVPLDEQNSLWRYIKLLELTEGNPQKVATILDYQDLQNLIHQYPLKFNLVTLEPFVEVWVERTLGSFSSWYEIFPRNQAPEAGKHGTLLDCIGRLPFIMQMGFDVLYLSPIHPIGLTKRKGKNNSLQAQAQEPGSPWAIGAKEGGHKSIHPELGSLEDFDKLQKAAKNQGIELALDIAFQCSPDHPYVTEHPEWFSKQADGKIKCAENPPNKYEDIYPFNFYCEDHQKLWDELRSIFTFWIERGVKIFRVDNPHTKPFAFWQWLLKDLKYKHPDLIFLAEAFTSPKPMNYLSKLGFTQSYSYFTWRNDKQELIEYLQALTQSESKHFFRANFFASTPDNLPMRLHNAPKEAFAIRLLLASLLCSNYGIVQGFELCENKALHQGQEEHADSDIFEIRHRNYESENNLCGLIGKINQIRKENPALQNYLNLEFYDCANSQILCFGKFTTNRDNCIIIVINLNAYESQEGTFELPLERFGLSEGQSFEVEDLLSNQKYHWNSRHNFVKLDPTQSSAHIFKLNSSC